MTIVKGPKDYEAAAAERIAKVLKPWDVRVQGDRREGGEQAPATCRRRSRRRGRAWKAASAPRPDGKPGPNTVGLRGARADDPDRHAGGQPADQVRGRAALPALQAGRRAISPAAAAATSPGSATRFRTGAESVTLIAYDADGMGEAVGSMYEAAAGLDPLTRWELPTHAAITPASRATDAAEAPVAWTAVVNDRVIALQETQGNVRVYTADGSVTTLQKDGKAGSTEKAAALPPAATAPLDAALAKSLLPDHVVKRISVANGTTAVGYWGGVVQTLSPDGSTRSINRMTNDVCGMVWVGDKLVVGVADGTVACAEAIRAAHGAYSRSKRVSSVNVAYTAYCASTLRARLVEWRNRLIAHRYLEPLRRNTLHLPVMEEHMKVLLVIDVGLE